MTERTLIVFKPDAVQRGIVGEILSRFEKAGFKMIGVKMVQPGESHYYTHYEDISKMISRRGEQAFSVTLELMQSGPVIAVVLEGVEAIERVRKMVGATEPKSADPGTVRGDYAHMSFDYADSQGVGIPNLLHASGDADEAQKEILHWFSDDQLFSYSTVHEEFVQKKGQNVKEETSE